MRYAFLDFNENETYVDAGAFTGDSIALFISAVRGKFDHIYSIEPDYDNNTEISKMIERIQPHYLEPLCGKITLIEKGVWSKNDILSFSKVSQHDLGGHLIEGGLNTKLANSTQTKVPVTSIDFCTAQDATFIKYEVEGSELEGLKGAQRTIEKNKPKLAVAVYHKPEDLLVIPRYVRGLNMGYKIGFRQHDCFKPDATYIYCF